MAGRWTFADPNPIAGYTVGLELRSPLDANAVARVSALGAALANDLPRKVEQRALLPFSPILGAPSQTPAGTVMGVIFDELNRDGTVLKQLAVIQNSVTYFSMKYERWKEYWPVAERLLHRVVEVILPSNAISAFLLNAVNRFTLEGDQEDIAMNELISKDCEFVAPNVLTTRMPCHSFHGFMATHFDPPGRTISNINVAVEATDTSHGKLPVTINISVRLQLDSTFSDSSSLFAESSKESSAIAKIFQRMHDANNDLFARTLVRDIAERIPGLPAR